jgi:L-ascorbate metabolism protein UlaG (beta-lactamase superfamily)
MENREQGLFQRVLHFHLWLFGGEIMKIKYLGHAAFELALESGARIVFDPYTAGAFGTLDYGPIDGEFNVAVVSHDHEDHTCRSIVSRVKKVVNKAGRVELEGMTIESVACFHDETKGSQRGKNLMSVIEADGLRIAHLGDLGHVIAAKDFPMLKGVDVMMIPVGGHFTIDAAGAAKVVKELEPKIVIPMHYKTPKVDFPITPVENFTKLMDNVEKADGSELVVTKGTLPAKTKVVVLQPAN